MGFSRQEYWSALPFPPPGDLPDPGIKLRSRVSCVGRWILCQGTTWEAPITIIDKIVMQEDKLPTGGQDLIVS